MLLCFLHTHQDPARAAKGKLLFINDGCCSKIHKSVSMQTWCQPYCRSPSLFEEVVFQLQWLRKGFQGQKWEEEELVIGGNG